MYSSDSINTVSRGYAKEIQTEEYGFGPTDCFVASVCLAASSTVSITKNGARIRTIRSPRGIDVDNMAGKLACKRDLLTIFGFPVDRLKVPVIGIVSRFATQKGFDLIEEISADLVEEDILLTVIGTGEPRYEEMFRALAEAYPDKIGVRVTYNDELAHKIEAGADMFLMPSRYEPCGLNQIYSLRYGTIPIVRATGGWMIPSTEERLQIPGVLGTCAARSDTGPPSGLQGFGQWQKLVRNAMQGDFSWNASATEYGELYGEYPMNPTAGFHHHLLDGGITWRVPIPSNLTMRALIQQYEK